MMGRIFLLFFLLCVHSLRLEAAVNIFKISPYVYSEHGESLSLGWQYRGGEFKKQKLKIPVCGFKEAQYKLFGMKNPVKIQNLPCPGESSVVRIGFLADTQEGVKEDEVFSKMLLDFENSAVIYGGDLVQNGDNVGEWEDFFRATALLNSKTVVIPVIGNHEYRGDVKAENWKKYFGFDAKEAYYSTWVGPVHLIVLNSNFESDPSLVFKQALWLEKELQWPAPWKVVVFHHPPYSRSVMHFAYYPRKEYESLRENYVPLFEKYGVDVVLNGHSHIYERSFKNNIYYLTTGAAGGKMGHLGAQNPYEQVTVEERTVMEFEVSSQTFRATAFTIEGKTLDDIVIKK